MLLLARFTEYCHLRVAQTNTLGLLYASLELQFDMLRTVTPFYCVYQITPTPGITLNTSTAAGKVIAQHWKSKASYYEVTFGIVYFAIHCLMTKSRLMWLMQARMAL